MIPVKLSLRNFMCYRENVPPLELEGMHVVLLCGENGNGKSALFDAMTWALWGKSRAKSNDDLVHSGEKEMEVELQFDVGKQRYRIIRKYAKGSLLKPGQGDLELQIASNGDFRSIRGDTIRETEKKIIELLQMEYQTFTNSAFLMQGRADEFSIKQPGQRKEIIADILGLSVYDVFEEKAKSIGQGRESEVERLTSSIAEVETQLVDKGKYEVEQQRWSQELAQLQEKMKESQVILDNLRQKKEFLERKQEQLINIENSLTEKRMELSAWESRLEKHQSKIDEYQKINARQVDIDKGYFLYIQTKKINDEFNFKLSQLFNVTERIRQVEKTIAEAEKALIAGRAVLRNRIAEHETKIGKLPQLQEKAAQVQKRLAELAEIKKNIDAEKKRIQIALSELMGLESNNASLEEEIKALREKLDLLIGKGARCPLCESELGVEGREQLKAKLEVEMTNKTNAYRETEQEIDKRKLSHQTAEKELAGRESYLNNELPKAQTQFIVIDKEITEIGQVQKGLIDETAKLQEIEGHLQARDFAPEAQQTLLSLQDEQLQLGYDKAKHETCKKQLIELQPYEELKRKLEEANRSITEEAAALTSDQETAQTLRRSIKEMEERHNSLSQELLMLPEIIIQLNTASQAQGKYQDVERQIREEVSKLKERLNYYGNLEKSKQEKEQTLKQNSVEAAIYKELTEAFGKKGIQALLIERALPEIEVEANRLLGMMTDNRMSLRLESQRGTKKGSTIETLDIKIADELGTRNYEMYSGGESFRINLALRIALSKLLVKRAGASLPILIIDEGFGTQDSSGREKLVEAINSIQDDFEKIMVVTHLEELKDYFPVRINVIKTAAGSSIFVD